MILLITLLLIAVILIAFSALVISLTGAVGVVLFGDVLICVLIIFKCIKHIWRKIKK